MASSNNVGGRVIFGAEGAGGDVARAVLTALIERSSVECEWGDAAEAAEPPPPPLRSQPAADKRPEPSSEAALAASRSVLSLAEALLIAAVFAAAAYLAYNERLYAIEKYGRVIHEFDREGRRRRGAGRRRRRHRRHRRRRRRRRTACSPPSPFPSFPSSSSPPFLLPACSVVQHARHLVPR